ncbi:MAG: S41 family peptidase [Proteobacteria bacterium]|nr:S41 family peptidase [Pseudomonadota bacterium]
MRRFSASGFIVVVALAAAVVLTVIRPSPQGIISFGIGQPEVRAAPGKPAPAVNKHNLTALDVFNVTLVRIRDAYVDRDRIEPKKMLYSALDSVQFNIPEVLVEAFPERDEVVVVVNDKKKTFSTSEVDSPWRLSSKLKKIFRFIEAHMNTGADLARVEYAAVNGMLNTLDPHSVLLDPETAREMDVNTSGKFGGLGIVIRIHKRKLTIIRPMKGTPAWRAGLKRGDHIVQINDEVTENLSLQEAVDRMRGTPKTPITIWVRRQGTPDPIKFDLKRAVIRVESVDNRLLADNIGYIRLKQFSGRTGQEVKEAMADLRSQGAKGWVLDLRSNPGGLLEQAIKVADLFVDKGTIVTTVGGREREPRRAERKGTDKLPIAVLVNGNSASASEIVAGALKNLDRAVVIGSNTFGKGSVQVLYDNKDGSKLKLTIAQYLTPGDRSIQSLGIVPDVKLHHMIVPKANRGPRDRVRLLPPSRTYREIDLDAHLTSRYAKGDAKPKYELSYVFERSRRADPLDDTGDDIQPDPNELADDELDENLLTDFAIKLARDVVAQTSAGQRNAMIQQARRLIAKHRQRQHTKLVEALALLGIDWSDAAKKNQPAANLEARVTSDKPAYDAGDIVELTGVVTNHGAGSAYQVHARARSNHQAFEDAEFVFGRILPGETKTWTTRVQLSKSARDRVDEVRFEFREARGTKPAAAPLQIRIRAADRPVFAYSHQLIDSGNGDGLVQKGEQHRLRVTIKNTGAGPAAETTAILRNASGDGVLLKKARFELAALQPGQEKSVDFVFDVSRRFGGDEVVVEMTVYDAVLHENVIEKLRYKIRAPSPGPQKISGYVAVTERSTPIYEGASADSGTIATAPRGTSFRVTGKQGLWYRIQIAPDREGFIAAAGTKKTRSPRGKTAINPVWQVTPPAISLRIPSFVTDSATYKLSGKVRDDTHVEDVYIFVSNIADKVENKKVFYKSNRSGQQTNLLEFAADIPLWLGTNRVTVVARENDEVRATHTMYLLRTKRATTAAAPNAR